MTQIRGGTPVLPADLAKTDASNTWTGTQDFTGATVLGVSGPGGTSPDATTTSKGLVQLAGDLAGTAAAPTVPGLAGKVNASALAAVATSGAYTDLTGKPALAPVATSGAYTDLTGRPALAAVATSGAYSDLTGAPAVPTTYLRGKTTDFVVTSASYSNDPDLQVTSLPVGTYALDMFTTYVSGSTSAQNITIAGTATYAGGIVYMLTGQTTTVPLSLPASGISTAVTGRLQLQGWLTVTVAGSFVISTAAYTAGNKAGLGAGSWVRLSKLA